MDDTDRKDIDIKVSVEITGNDEVSLRERVKSIAGTVWILTAAISFLMFLCGSEELFIYVLLVSAAAFLVFELSKDNKRDI